MSETVPTCKLSWFFKLTTAKSGLIVNGYTALRVKQFSCNTVQPLAIRLLLAENHDHLQTSMDSDTTCKHGQVQAFPKLKLLHPYLLLDHTWQVSGIYWILWFANWQYAFQLPSSDLVLSHVNLDMPGLCWVFLFFHLEKTFSGKSGSGLYPALLCVFSNLRLSCDLTLGISSIDRHSMKMQARHLRHF